MLLFICIATKAFEISTVPISGSPPASMVRSKATFDPDSNEIIIFGGQDASTLKFKSTLYTFNIESLIWGEIIPESYESPPELTSSEIFLTVDKKLLIFFGSMKNSISGNVYSFTLGTKIWSLEKLTGDYIEGRVNYASKDYYYNGVRYLAIFGGLTSKGIDNNLYIIEFSNLNVRKVVENGYSIDKAYSKTLVFYDEKLYLYGVVLNNSDDNAAKNMDVFDLQTEKWEIIQFTENYPSARLGQISYVYNHSMYVLFGLNTKNSTIYEDVWSYNFLTSTWTNHGNFSQQILFASVQIDSKVFILFGRIDFAATNSISYFDLNSDKLQYSLVVENKIFPSKRKNHCMRKFNDNILIFGGISEDGTYLNDIWKFYISSQHWEYIYSSGTIPLARSSFGCTLESGTGFLIYGGSSASGILGDLYYYDMVSSYWAQLDTIGDNPGLRTGLCICSADAFTFFIGGSNGVEAFKDVWHYDYLTSKFKKVVDLPIGIINANCWNEFIGGFHYIYVISGSTINFNPNKCVYKIIAEEKQGFFNSTVELGICSNLLEVSESALVLTGDTALLVLGSNWNSFLKPAIISYNYKTEQIISEDTGSLILFGHGAVHMEDSIYIFGGGYGYDNVKLPESTGNTMYKITSQPDKIQIGCSRGNEKVGDLCMPCPKGTYYNEPSCVPCPIGTFSESISADIIGWCTPCDYGTYNDKEGSTYCYECPSYSLCPIGSTSLLSYSSVPSYSKNTFYQPKPYTGQSSFISNITKELWMYLGLLIIIIIFGIIYISAIRENIGKLDLFVASHGHEINIPVIHKKTKLGGVFSLIYALVASIIIIGSIMTYQLDNIIEIKGLVPLVTIDEPISAENFVVDAQFFTYGGLCIKESNFISVKEFNIKYKKRNYSTLKDSSNCHVSIAYSNIIISDAATITINLNEMSSRATFINANVSASSSIPSEPSNISVSIVPPDFKQIFIGLIPSIIPLSLIPSVFYSQNSKWPSIMTGYHIESGGNPIIGETATQKTINSKLFLSLQIQLSIEKSALITKRNINNSLFIFIGGLLGSIVGIFSAFGSALGIFEDWIDKLIKKYQKHQLIKNIKIGRDDINKNFFVDPCKLTLRKYAKVCPSTIEEI